jgi:hypothetical protein
MIYFLPECHDNWSAAAVHLQLRVLQLITFALVADHPLAALWLPASVCH